MQKELLLLVNMEHVETRRVVDPASGKVGEEQVAGTGLNRDLLFLCPESADGEIFEHAVLDPTLRFQGQSVTVSETRRCFEQRIRCQIGFRSEQFLSNGIFSLLDQGVEKTAALVEIAPVQAPRKQTEQIANGGRFQQHGGTTGCPRRPPARHTCWRDR